MSKILVSGLINIETTLQIEQFPVNYYPVTYPFHGIHSTISGVGLNLSKALTTLGNQVNFLSIIGSDLYEKIIRTEIKNLGIDDQYLLTNLSKTAQSVILYEKGNRRQIHTDLKDIQEHTYPLDLFKKAVEDCDICALCNINFNRQLLTAAKSSGKVIATDVHAIHDPDDSYNRDFMAAANILFLSDENLNVPAHSFIQMLWDRYQNKIIVVGMGDQGALMGLLESKSILQIPAIQTCPIQNTIGAGDALFSAFVHSYRKTKDPILALQQAVLFASLKIGSIGAAEGFIDSVQLTTLFEQYQNMLTPNVFKV
jgi:ribokinase